MSAPKVVLSAVLLVAAILLLALASNRILDAFEIANAEGLTIEQKKEIARDRQYEWDHHRFNR